METRYIIAGIIVLIVLYMLTRSSSRKNRFAMTSRKKCCKSKCDNLKPNNRNIQEEIPLPNKKNSNYYGRNGFFRSSQYEKDVKNVKNKNIEIRKENDRIKSEYEKCINTQNSLGASDGSCKICN